jgi:uncharacterized protein YdeI (YjbR/CyaY-like superfamily)
MSEPVYFDGAEPWLRWLEAHHDRADGLVLGFYKAGSGKAGITYREALEVALAYGWIDAVRRTVDGERWSIRFTPRKKGSIWSRINLAHVDRLEREGRMRAPGLAVHAARDRRKEKSYSFEQENWQLSPDYEERLKAEPDAWTFFERQPVSYRRPASWWVMSARQEPTRERRLAKLIADSAAGRRLAHLTSPGRAKDGKAR